MTEFHTFTLPNGIRCIFMRIKSPVAYCALTINTGSRDELPAEHGIAHFTEHMLFKGTVRRRAHHISNRLEKLGGELNAFTTKEETVVHATTLKSDFPKAAELIADVVFNSTYPQRELEREREVILDEINSYKDSPVERIYDEFEDMLFAGSSLGHNILGTRRTVARITGEDIRAFTGRCHNTDQMVFSAAANISPGAFARVAEKYFSLVPASHRTFSRRTPPEDNVLPAEVSRRTFQSHCIIGARAYGNRHPGRVALALLMNYLGGPAANSRLSTILREKNGLTYSVEATYTPYNDTGMAAVYFGCDRENTTRCMELVRGEFERARSTAMTERQLSAVKKQFLGQLAIAMESNENHMLSAAKSFLTYNAVDSHETLVHRIMDVTPEAILTAANDVFSGSSYLLYK